MVFVHGFSRRSTQLSPYVLAKTGAHRRVYSRGGMGRYRHGASVIQRAWRMRQQRKKRYSTSQFKKPSQSVWRGRTRNYSKKYAPMKLTNQHISRRVHRTLGSLTNAGVCEEKIKYIQSPSTKCGFIATNNSALASMGGICYNFSQAINVADQTQATGFGATNALEVFKLQRAPSTSLATQTSLNNNVLQGRYMFCKYIKLQIDIQLNPNLITSVASLTSLGSQFLLPAMFRCLIVRKKPTGQNGGLTPVSPSFGRDLFLAWAGPMNAVGLAQSSPESSEQPVEPRQALYKNVNLTKYQVLKDFKFSAAFPTITGSAFNSKHVGYKKLDITIPVNQKLEYSMGAPASSNVEPINTDCDYSLLIFSGLPGVNQAEILTGSPTDPAIQPTHATHWRSSVQGKMCFVDS